MLKTWRRCLAGGFAAYAGVTMRGFTILTLLITLIVTVLCAC